MLGAIFGSVFHMSAGDIEVVTKSGKEKISDFSEVKFFVGDSTVAVFGSDAQLSIIKFSKSFTDKKIKNLVTVKVTTKNNDIKVFANVIEITKSKSIGALIKPAGDIFIRLLNMIAVPLVFASLLVGAASLSDLRHVARIGGKTITIFMFTTVLQ